MPNEEKMTPNPNENGGVWKMEDWKLTEQSSDGHTVIYEYLPELTIHKRIHAKAWDDLAVLMNARQGGCFLTVWK